MSLLTLSTLGVGRWYLTSFDESAVFSRPIGRCNPVQCRRCLTASRIASRSHTCLADAGVGDFSGFVVAIDQYQRAVTPDAALIAAQPNPWLCPGIVYFSMNAGPIQRWR